MKQQVNKRNFTRVSIELEADVRPRQGDPISARAANLSLKGVFVLTDLKYDPGTTVELTLYLGGRAEGIAVEIQGKVARATADGMGIQFTRIEGVESFEHLRNLVRYNATTNDSAEVERELDNYLDRTEQA